MELTSKNGHGIFKNWDLHSSETEDRNTEQNLCDTFHLITCNSCSMIISFKRYEMCRIQLFSKYYIQSNLDNWVALVPIINIYMLSCYYITVEVTFASKKSIQVLRLTKFLVRHKNVYCMNTRGYWRTAYSYTKGTSSYYVTFIQTHHAYISTCSYVPAS